jgi:hypothetical protein
VATPASLSSAADAYTTQAQIAAAAVVAARAVRPQTPEKIAATLAAYQVLAAQQAALGVAPMLAEQGIPTTAAASVLASSLAGYTSAGAPLATMFETYETAAQLAMLAASAVQDAGRNGAFLGMAVRPSVTGYVRMLNPPSCSRCAILAGRFYLLNQGFERHPLCDCRHIPVGENSRDLTTNPSDYFESLSRADQDRIFTAAGAQAIRDGADINQVVNARRGMRKAQLFGRETWTTLEGTTKRGVARRAMGQGRPARLMPESIYALATDRDDALRLLSLYGYITS